MTMTAPRLLLGACLVVAFGVSCGDDDTTGVDAAATVDGGAADGGVTIDGAVDAAAADAAPTTTECGGLQCDRATQICMQCACGGPTSVMCVPIPAGCDADRTCACVADTVCATTPIESTCSDVGDNTVLCDTGLD